MADIPLIVHPLRPHGPGWVQWPWYQPAGYARPYAIERWYNRGQEVQAVSAIEVVKPEGHAGARPEYHISVSGVKHDADKIYRVSESRAQWVLKEFGLEGWFEDNHVPGGKVRNYWLAVAEPMRGEVCACVESEPTMREMRGDYVWRGAPKS